jgi:hypothetical protein
VLLMFYYKPYPDVAYLSIKDIHFVVPTGRFIRNIHRWAGNVMVVAVLLHMARAFYTASYRAPREFNWLIGMGLLVVTLGLSFTGYLLPWDQLAFWAITIGANIAQSPREITDALGITETFDPGGFQRLLLLGSDQVGDEALIRFYLLHVMILPLALLALVSVHFWRIRKDGGLAKPADVDARLGPPREPIQPVFTEAPPRPTTSRRSCGGAHRPSARAREHRAVDAAPLLCRGAVFMLTIALCLGARARLGRAAQGTRQPGGAREPGQGALVLPRPPGTGRLFGVHGRHRHPDDRPDRPGADPVPGSRDRRHRRVVRRPGRGRLVAQAVVVGFGAALAVEVVAINFGWIREWYQDVPQLVITFVNPGTVLTAIYAVYSLWLIRRHNSTRAGALGLFTCFLCGFILLTIVGTHFRGPNWDFYWSPSQWPGGH